MSRDVRFLVVGSAHLDVLATATGDHSTVDKIGTVGIEIGGTACNVALALRALHAPVALLTAANNSPYSMFVTSHLSRSGVDVMVERDDTLPLAAFSAHIADGGEMLGAVSSMPVEHHRFSDEVVEFALDKADCVILDCNLSEDSLLQIARMAGERMTPVYVAGVSEEKCVRAIAIAGLIDGLFINRREADYLARKVAPNTEGKYADLATIINCPLIVTSGEEGAYLARPGRAALAKIQPPSLGDATNFLGMGDAFMAGTLFAHLGDELNLDTAATAILPMVARVSKEAGCSVGASGTVEKMLCDMQRRAYTCPTTKILNRAATEEELERMILGTDSTGAAFSVALVDVDFFKQINDTLGHNVGDQVLQLVASTIHDTLRGADVVGRWGGDEFIILILNDDLAALSATDRIRKAVLDACASIAKVTLSIGVAQWRPGMRSPKDLLEAADTALYAVKRNGRDGAMTEAQVLAQKFTETHGADVDTCEGHQEAVVRQESSPC